MYHLTDSEKIGLNPNWPHDFPGSYFWKKLLIMVHFLSWKFSAGKKKTLLVVFNNLKVNFRMFECIVGKQVYVCLEPENWIIMGLVIFVGMCFRYVTWMHTKLRKDRENTDFHKIFWLVLSLLPKLELNVLVSRDLSLLGCTRCLCLWSQLARGSVDVRETWV